MTKSVIGRRTMLRNAGAATIGLPFLEEMLISSASAAEKAAAPVRAFNVFFGLGIPAPLQQEGFDGVLEPLKPLSKKLLIMRGVDQVRADEKGINAHYDGATAAFTAEPPDGEAKAGGASIHQALRRSAYPKGRPPGMVPALVGGTFFRRSRIGRYVHSYNPDGTVAATMQESPRDLFERVFGTIDAANENTDDRRTRLKRSVLDTVVDEYKYYKGDNSPLGGDVERSRGRASGTNSRIRTASLHNERQSRRSAAATGISCAARWFG
jgi:hypothetical protein